MPEEMQPMQRSAKTEGGNYTEAVGGHYIQAENVYINGTSISETAASLQNKESTQKRLAFAIAGSIDQVDEAKLKAIVSLLQKMTGDTSIEILAVEEGSIRLILGGSAEGLAKLEELYELGELIEVLDTPVEYVQFVGPETPNHHNEIANDAKSHLIQEIITQGATRRDLSGADLSGADLRDTDLNHANLSRARLSRARLNRANLSNTDFSRTNLNIANLCGANLSRANLSRASLFCTNLSGADLSGADLSGSNLSGADLSGADLSGSNLSGADLSSANLSGAILKSANLSGAILRSAIVQNAQFTNSLGISEANKADLKRRGAIFDDSPGDRASTYSLTPH